MVEGAIILDNGPVFKSIRQLRVQIDLGKFLTMITHSIKKVIILSPDLKDFEANKLYFR